MFLFGSPGKFIFNKFPLKSLLLPQWKKNWIEIKTLVDVLVGLNSESNSNCLCAQLWDWQEQFSGNEKSLSLSLSLTCSSGLGMSPAVPAAATFLACHQLWSSLLMICRMSPVLKGIPACAQGMRSSSRGSYSNWARTKMSQGGGAER